MDFIDNTSVPSLQQALNGLSQRQHAITSNIANVSVPGYKSQRVVFEDALQQALNSKRGDGAEIAITNAGHLPAEARAVDDIEIETLTSQSSEMHSGGNTVDIDSEMVNLAKTGLQYRAVSQIARRQVDSLRSVIRGGS